jgi:hypothetical protein
MALFTPIIRATIASESSISFSISASEQRVKTSWSIVFNVFSIYSNKHWMTWIRDTSSFVKISFVIIVVASFSCFLTTLRWRPRIACNREIFSVIFARFIFV